MKKLILLLVGLMPMIALPVTAGSASNAAGRRFSLAALGGLHAFANQDFKKIYGANQPEIKLDLGWQVGSKFNIFLSVAHLSASGELTYSKEATTFRLTSLEGGASLDLPMGRFVAYAGAGAGVYLVKEENVIASLDEKKGGFFFLGGLRFHFSKALFAAAQLKYVFLELKPFAKSIDLAGWFAGGGLGVTF
jgi:opacity protein-like surface antigen